MAPRGPPRRAAPWGEPDGTTRRRTRGRFRAEGRVTAGTARDRGDARVSASSRPPDRPVPARPFGKRVSWSPVPGCVVAAGAATRRDPRAGSGGAAGPAGSGPEGRPLSPERSARGRRREAGRDRRGRKGLRAAAGSQDDGRTLRRRGVLRARGVGGAQGNTRRFGRGCAVAAFVDVAQSRCSRSCSAATARWWSGRPAPPNSRFPRSGSPSAGPRPCGRPEDGGPSRAKRWLEPQVGHPSGQHRSRASGRDAAGCSEEGETRIG